MAETLSTSLLDSFKNAMDRQKLASWMNSTADNFREVWTKTTGIGSSEEEGSGLGLVGSIRDSINTAVWGEESSCFGLPRSQVKKIQLMRSHRGLIVDF
jgi:hypothetical protein